MSNGNETDRIRLCEAMGWERNLAGDWHNIPQGKLPRPHFDLPDPFTDANADYAVLEWMRKRKEDLSIQQWGFQWTKFARLLPDASWYRIGDYARAALKVIDE